MSNEKNKFGLGRTIPGRVRQEVRRRSRFGCVLCRCGFYDYHHIDPPYAEATRHDPDGICCLCPNCHRSVTNGIIVNEAVARAYRHVQFARTDEVAEPSGPLGFTDANASLAIGGLYFPSSVQRVLRYHGHDLILLEPGADGRPGAISAIFTDADGRPALELDRNQWIGSVDSWDIEVQGRRVSVSRGRGDSSVRLRLEPPGKVVIEHLEMRLETAYIMASEHAWAMGRVLANGEIGWLAARITITRNGPGACVFEYLDPDELEEWDRRTEHLGQSLATADRSMVMGSPAGLINKPLSLRVASNCAFRLYGTGWSVLPRDVVARAVFERPDELFEMFRKEPPAP